jgi:hypothetical protein
VVWGCETRNPERLARRLVRITGQPFLTGARAGNTSGRCRVAVSGKMRPGRLAE